MQVEQLEAQNKSLMHEAEEAKAYSTKLERELQRVERRIAECIGETARLHEEASLLRQAVKVLLSATPACWVLFGPPGRSEAL